MLLFYSAPSFINTNTLSESMKFKITLSDPTINYMILTNVIVKLTKFQLDLLK